MNEMGTAQGLIPIPKPRPIPVPMSIPAPGQIPSPIPVPNAGVLPPFVGAATTPTVPVPALAGLLVTGESAQPAETGATPQGVPPQQERSLAQRLMGMPSPELFWSGTATVSTTLPTPEDYWWGAKTTSQIYLPTPEEFWRG